jgi:hypothetical protein
MRNLLSKRAREVSVCFFEERKKEMPFLASPDVFCPQLSRAKVFRSFGLPFFPSPVAFIVSSETAIAFPRYFAQHCLSFFIIFLLQFVLLLFINDQVSQCTQL